MGSDNDESSRTLTVENVQLPQKAYEDVSTRSRALTLSDTKLVDLLYRCTAGQLQVYVRASSSATEPESCAPFQSQCTIHLVEANPLSFNEWTCIAQFDDETSKLPSAHTVINARGSLAVPGGLCHPHLHLDKCFLLDRCTVSSGTFDEAMKKTAAAKADFNYDDLMNRGRRLITASISHGVTAIRAHVEVDPTVNLLCIEAGSALKTEFASSCDVELVAFAQDPLFYPNDSTKQQRMAQLLEKAASSPHISAIGSAPYVESSAEGSKAHLELQQRNIRTVFDLAAKNGKDVDLHLDYDLDPSSDSLVPFVLQLTAARTWKVQGRSRRITLGHCTKLSVLPSWQIAQIRAAIEAIPRGEGEGSPVSFVGLPPSDVYMQGRSDPYGLRSRATLPLLQLEDEINALGALGVNNVANLFTPQGDADPLALLPSVTALYQDATQPDRLLEFVSTKARHASGLDATFPNLWKHLVIIDSATSVQSAVLAPPFGRITIKNGRMVSSRTVLSSVITQDR